MNCNDCHSIFKDPKHHLSPETEQKHYLNHNNDVNDIGYQQFVSPIIQKIIQKFNKSSIGLDFGAGTGPIITKLLKEKGYQIYQYDPFFHPNENVLSNEYDFIICCEVIEHFFRPHKEFRLLKQLLKSNGVLFLMTETIPNDRPLNEWYYIIDPTHVFFYTQKSFDWIKEFFSFSKVIVDKRIIEIFN